MFLIAYVVLSLIVTIRANDYICGTGPEKCDADVRIRSYDGSCNNIKNPKWGSTGALYQRILPAAYDDGISSYRKSKSGGSLPNPRLLSQKIFTSKEVLSNNLTVNAAVFGALFVHDLSKRTNVPRSESCCTTELRYTPNADPDTCEDIQVPENDPFYTAVDVQCFPFQRSVTNLNNNCSLFRTYGDQVSRYTAYIDVHVLYGTTEEENSELRTFSGGKLKSDSKDGKEMFPISTSPTTDCRAFSDNVHCFKAGDSRVSLTPHFAILNVILLREHNRIADKLLSMNPNWTDEDIFQTARSIMIGMFQHITFTELLPASLGESIMFDNGILHDTSGFVQDYDEEVNPGPFSEFSQAAFKHGHSMVDGPMNFINENRQCTGGITFEGKYNNVSIIEEDENFDLLTRGISTQHAWASDKYHGKSVTQTVFDNEVRIGFDARAVDIKRSRDHGLPSYNDYRVACGLPRALKFSDFCDVIPTEDVELLETLYEHPDDVDLVVGGNLEKSLPGAIVGPTFANIWIKQLQQIRKGDRLFYDQETGPFTIEQLNEIRKSSLSRLLCDNSDNITHMQPNAFMAISPVNEVVLCENLPTVDLTKWEDC